MNQHVVNQVFDEMEKYISDCIKDMAKERDMSAADLEKLFDENEKSIIESISELVGNAEDISGVDMRKVESLISNFIRNL